VSSFIADAAVIAGAIAGPTFLVATFSNALLYANPVIAKGIRCTGFFGQLRAIIIADMDGGRVLAGNQAGLTNLQILASSVHAHKIKGALFEAGPT
jgi:hypothetical protein